MSNDIILSIKNQLAAVQGELDADTLAVAGSGQNTKRISIKGGVFRKMVGGKEIGSIEDRHMNIVFVKMAHRPSRQYYAGAYVEGAKVSPVCWSTDSKTPDSDVKNPLASNCDQCPKAIKGSGNQGQGTACRMSWRTAVVLPNDPGGDVMQLVLPAASVFGEEENGRWPFRPYIQMLANHSIAASRVITKMQFDTKAPSPRVLFSPAGVVNLEDVATLKAQGETLAAENAVRLNVYQREEKPNVEGADSGEAVEAPAGAPPDVVAAVQQEPDPEPTVRTQSTKVAPPAAEKDVSDVIKKWSTKK